MRRFEDGRKLAIHDLEGIVAIWIRLPLKLQRKQQVPPLHRRWRSGFGRNDKSKPQSCGTGTPSVRRRTSPTGERLFSRRTRYNSGCAIPFLIASSSSCFIWSVAFRASSACCSPSLPCSSPSLPCFSPNAPCCSPSFDCCSPACD